MRLSRFFALSLLPSLFLLGSCTKSRGSSSEEPKPELEIKSGLQTTKEEPKPEPKRGFQLVGLTLSAGGEYRKNKRVFDSSQMYGIYSKQGFS